MSGIFYLCLAGFILYVASSELRDHWTRQKGKWWIGKEKDLKRRLESLVQVPHTKVRKAARYGLNELGLAEKVAREEHFHEINGDFQEVSGCRKDKYLHLGRAARALEKALQYGAPTKAQTVH